MKRQMMDIADLGSECFGISKKMEISWEMRTTQIMLLGHNSGGV
jgi:hypothetical protein